MESGSKRKKEKLREKTAWFIIIRKSLVHYFQTVLSFFFTYLFMTFAVVFAGWRQSNSTLGPLQGLPPYLTPCHEYITLITGVHVCRG